MNSTTALTPTAAAADGIIPNTYYDNSVTSYCCSTPYFYSAPSSPMHHFLKSSSADTSNSASDRSSFEFDFFPGVNNSNADDDDEDDRSSTMSSADELFLNGQIRPIKLFSHLQQPQNLAPLIDVEDKEEEDEEGEGAEIEAVRGRDWKKLRNKSLRRKARSLSPLRTDVDVWNDDNVADQKQKKADEESYKIEIPSASSSRSSSGGTSSKRWLFLKDFIRSKSDGSNSNSTNGVTARLWPSISFSHIKATYKLQNTRVNLKEKFLQTANGGRLRNGIAVSDRKSAHEAHYRAKRAQAEEMRRKTFLPYRQGLLGCLGFSSKTYGAMDGLTRTLNAVSSR